MNRPLTIRSFHQMQITIRVLHGQWRKVHEDSLVSTKPINITFLIDTNNNVTQYLKSLPIIHLVHII